MMNAQQTRGLLIRPGALLRAFVHAFAEAEEGATPLMYRMMKRIRRASGLIRSPRKAALNPPPRALASQSVVRAVPEISQNYALNCLRLAADCKSLAADVSAPGQKAHFLSMAAAWEETAQKHVARATSVELHLQAQAA
jgi:hypothetical protein